MADDPDKVLPAEQLIATLFPPGIAVAWSTAPAPGEALLRNERRGTQGMAGSRRQTFQQGRECAHRALRRLGCTEVAVPVGEQRAPLWPPGITGSIAHCGARAVAVAARSEVAASVGVDLETAGELEPGVLDIICTPAERQWLAQSGAQDAGRLLFAIKESIYKCLWTRVRRFIDFDEIEIDLDPGGHCYRARAPKSSLDPALVAALRGNFANLDGLVLTSAYLPPALTL